MTTRERTRSILLATRMTTGGVAFGHDADDAWRQRKWSVSSAVRTLSTSTTLFEYSIASLLDYKQPRIGLPIFIPVNDDVSVRAVC